MARGRCARVAALAWLALACVPALAASTSLVGQLDPNDAQSVVLYPFTLSAPGTVGVQSWGYGGSSGAPGGVNAAGAAIPAGGFDPYVSIFSGTGAPATFLASNDDGSCPPGTVDAALCRDSTLTTGVLPAGSYTLAISAFLNMSLAENLGSGTLGDGFVGLGSFGTRTNAYAVDIAGATVVAPAKLLSLSPSGLTFGPQTAGVASGPLAVVVTNTGTANVTLGAIGVSGANAAQFAAGGTCAGVLAPGGACAIVVVFTPNVAGPFSATITLASDAANAPHAFAVGGTGTTAPVPIAVLSTNDLDFGKRILGHPTKADVLVTNTGSATLVLGVVSGSGPNLPDFAFDTGCDGASLGQGASCTIKVTFTPGVAGARSAALSIPSNAANSPVSVALSGIGVVQGPASVPAMSSFALVLTALLLALLATLVRRRERDTHSPRRRQP